MSELVLLVVLVHRLTVYLDETVELHHLTLSHKCLVAIAQFDVHGGLLDLGIGHLAGDGALPDQVVEALLLTCTLNLRLVHIGGTDGLVSLLGTLRTGVILTCLAVFLAIETHNLLLAGS